jgi:site-specific DNA recombinase
MGRNRPSAKELAKKTKGGEWDYVYYRCSKYSTKGHPRIRLTEANLDQQVLALFGKLRIEDAEVRDWVLRVLRARTREEQDHTREQRTELQRQLSLLEGQKGMHGSFSTPL